MLTSWVEAAGLAAVSAPAVSVLELDPVVLVDAEPLLPDPIVFPDESATGQ